MVVHIRVSLNIGPCIYIHLSQVVLIQHRCCYAVYLSIRHPVNRLFQHSSGKLIAKLCKFHRLVRLSKLHHLIRYLFPVIGKRRIMGSRRCRSYLPVIQPLVIWKHSVCLIDSRVHLGVTEFHIFKV